MKKAHLIFIKWAFGISTKQGTSSNLFCKT